MLSISYPKNVWQSQCQRAFPIYIHLRVLLFWVLYLFSSWFLSGVRLGSNLILFMWLFSSPKNLFWRTFPFPLSICDTLVEHQSTVMHWFISGFNILFFFFFWYIYLYINTVLHVLSRFRCIWLYATLWTAAFQVPLSVGFSSKNTGGGCHFLLQGIFPTQGTHISLSPVLASRFFTTSATLT